MKTLNNKELSYSSSFSININKKDDKTMHLEDNYKEMEARFIFPDQKVLNPKSPDEESLVYGKGW